MKHRNFLILIFVIALSDTEVEADSSLSKPWEWTPDICACDPISGPACQVEPWNIQHRHFWAKVIDVVDGNKIDMSINLGLGVWKRERIRLKGIKSKGLFAEDFIKYWTSTTNLGVDRWVILETNQWRDKHGFLIADLVECGSYLTQDMVDAGRAVWSRGKDQ